MPGTIICAHRGLDEAAPENTSAAFTAGGLLLPAIAAGPGAPCRLVALLGLLAFLAHASGARAC